MVRVEINLLNGVNDHHVALGLTGDIGGYGADQPTSQSVDATVADNEEVSIVVSDDGHERLHRCARLNDGLYIGCADSIGGGLGLVEDVVGGVITHHLDRVLAQGLCRLVLILVLGNADDQLRAERRRDARSAFHRQQGGLGTISAHDNCLVRAHVPSCTFRLAWLYFPR